MKLKTVIAAALVAMPAAVRAQSADTLSLDGRSALAFGLGLTSRSSTSASLTGASSSASGQIGSLEFTHWFRPVVAFQVSASVLGAEATSTPGQVHDNTLTPILAGFSISPRSFALSRNARPYLSAQVGPYIHTVSDVVGSSTSNTVETSFGARFGAGVNWFIARHFLLGADLNYHAVGEFDHPDAITKHPSGFGASVLIGFAWGGR